MSEVYSSAESKARVFQWVRDKLKFMQEQSTKSNRDLKIFEQFKKEITIHIREMILLDAV